MDKFSELKAAAEKAKELGGINNYKKGKDAIVAFKAAANPAAILALLAERDSNQQNYQNAMEELRIERAQRQAADQRIAELEAKLSKMPRACDGKEQDAFIKFALNNKFSTECHPMHFLFLDKQTSAARRAWGAAIAYCSDTVEGDA